MNLPKPSKIPLSPVDTAWFRMEDPTNLMMITGIFAFDQLLDFDELKTLIQTKLLRYRRFRQRVVQPRLSFLPPYWEDDPNFDINAHLHRIALPDPGDQTTLQNLVNDFMSTPLDFSKPLWQFHLVENFGDGCALLCRLHHCIADGIALMKVLLNLTDDKPIPVDSKLISENRKLNQEEIARYQLKNERAIKRQISFSRRLFRQGFQTISNPSQTLKMMKLGAESTEALTHLLLLSPDPPNPFKGKLGVMKRCVWSQPVLLEDVKAICRVTGGTVNDVMVTAVTGALSRYLRSRGEPTGGLDFRAVIPVNLRPVNEKPKLGNAFGLVFLSLPVGIDDPLDRLQELKLRMDGIKGTPQALVAFGILNAMGAATQEVEDFVVELFGKKATTVMTNVPGPKEVRYFTGRPIRQIMFWVPQSGRLGLGVSIISYAGEVLVGVASDAGLTPDPESIIEAFHTEFDDLMELVRLAREAESEILQDRQMKSRCQAITKRGEQCKNSTVIGTSFCHIHNR